MYVKVAAHDTVESLNFVLKNVFLMTVLIPNVNWYQSVVDMSPVNTSC